MFDFILVVALFVHLCYTTIQLLRQDTVEHFAIEAYRPINTSSYIQSRGALAVFGDKMELSVPPYRYKGRLVIKRKIRNGYIYAAADSHFYVTAYTILWQPPGKDADLISFRRYQLPGTGTPK